MKIIFLFIFCGMILPAFGPEPINDNNFTNSEEYLEMTNQIKLLEKDIKFLQEKTNQLQNDKSDLIN